VALISVWHVTKKHRISWMTATVAAFSVLLLVILALPPGFWQRLFVDRVASSPYAADFLVNSAAVDDLDAVVTLVSHGVPPSARNRMGKTGLHVAAGAGHIRVLEFLLSKGVDINAVDRFGDSPFQVAVSQEHEAAAKFLADRGAHQIRGPEELRNKAMEQIVQDDIERMDKAYDEDQNKERTDR